MPRNSPASASFCQGGGGIWFAVFMSGIAAIDVAPSSPLKDPTMNPEQTKQPRRGDELSKDDPNVLQPSPDHLTNPNETQPSEERGERVAHGKQIHRGGKSEGHVPGATENK
jgi:hypothetical protein